MHIRLSEACALRARRGMSMETDEHELFTAGCDPDGVVEECGGGWYPGSSTPGYKMGMLRIPQECASFGCGRKHDSHLWNYKRIRIPKMRNPKEVQRDIVAYALRARNPEVCEADLLNQHPGGVPADSPGSQTPGNRPPPKTPFDPGGVASTTLQKRADRKGNIEGEKNALSNRR